MIIDVEPDLMVALVATVNHALDTVIALEGEPGGDVTRSAMSSAKSAAVSLSILTNGWFDDGAGSVFGEEEGEDREATRDPATCGHPTTLDLPGQKMCESCGASENPDGSWSVWT